LREESTAEGKMERLIELMQEITDGELDEGGLRHMFGSNWKSMFSMLSNYQTSEKFHHDSILIKTTQNLIAYDTNELWGLDKVTKSHSKFIH